MKVNLAGRSNPYSMSLVELFYCTTLAMQSFTLYTALMMSSRLFVRLNS